MSVPHILIVDDEPGILDVCARALRRHGFEVTTASDANTARILLRSRTVDMLVTDVRMPGEDGISLLQTVRETENDLPLMIITGHADYSSIDAAINLNITSFMSKPFNIRDFVNEVKRGLGLKEPPTQEDQSALGELAPIFIKELRRRQIPVLEGIIRRDPLDGRIVLIPSDSDGEIPVAEWLLEYTAGEPSYLIVLPRQQQ